MSQVFNADFIWLDNCLGSTTTFKGCDVWLIDYETQFGLVVLNPQQSKRIVTVIVPVSDDLTYVKAQAETVVRTIVDHQFLGDENV